MRGGDPEGLGYTFTGQYTCACIHVWSRVFTTLFSVAAMSYCGHRDKQLTT